VPSINPNSAHTACGKLSFVNPRIKTQTYLFKELNRMKLRNLYDRKQNFLTEEAASIKTHVHACVTRLNVYPLKE
jgi:hypothetical protein